jgi:hypothetical protein
VTAGLLFFLGVATAIDVLESIRPTDVIYQRDNLLAWWSIPGEVQRVTALNGRTPLPGWESFDASGEVGRRWMEEAIRDAQLYWVSPEMTEVIETLAPSIPDCYPQPPVENGFVMFAKSVAGTDAANGLPISTTAILWDATVLAHTGACIALETYAWRDLVSDYVTMPEDDKERFRRAIPTRLFPTGGSEWPTQSMTSDFSRLPADDPTKRLSMLEDRRLMATFWALCSQRIVVESVEPPSRAQLREAKRRGHREPPPVRVIRLREVTHAGHGGAGQARDWSHRWIVGSHWRSQWYPSTGQHRPKLIDSYVKGPQDKPLIVRETVRALVR